MSQETEQALPEVGGRVPASEQGPEQIEEPIRAEEQSEDQGEEQSEEHGMTLTQHLQELRVRLFKAIIAVVLGMLACYGFSGTLLEVMARPMLDVLPPGVTFLTFSPTEIFFSELKMAMVAGVFLVSPYIFYQLWKFVAPGLYPHERKWLLPIAFVTALLFTVGALFGYFVVFPFGFTFFVSLSHDYSWMVFEPRLQEYMGFAIKLLFAFGIAFELPLVIFFLARVGIVSSVGLRKNRKYAVLFAFVVGAILTPPDVVSQTLMAGPLILLYEIGVWVAHFFGKKRSPVEADEDEEEAGTQAGEEGDTTVAEP